MQFLHGGVGALAVQTMEVARLLPESWSPLANDIITWGAVAVALVAIWQKIIKPASEHLALLNRIWDKLQHEFEPNSGEFEPNSGSSLRDAVDRTDLRLAELNDRFDDLKIHIERVDKKLAQHMADVKDNGEAS